MSYWLVKSDPESYSIEDFRRDGSTVWDGVRNYQARNNMNLMKKDDSVLVYHSNKEKAVMGLAKVIAEAHQDPTTEDERWTAVDLALSEVFDKQPDLALIKKTKGLSISELDDETRKILYLIKDSSGSTIHDLFKVYIGTGGKLVYRTFYRKVKNLELNKYVRTQKVYNGKKGNTSVVHYMQ